MAADTEHEAFLQPENKDAKIWRFMDFTKLVSLISTKKIYLSRSDKFKDPFEGSVPKAYKKKIQTFLTSNGVSAELNLVQEISQFKKSFKETAFINCWHLNEHESAAMWDLYSKTEESVSIQTTYKKLEELLPEDVYLGMVKYIDYNTDSFPEKYMLFEPFIHKRKSFEHEKEIRIFKMIMPSKENFKVASGDIGLPTSNMPHGINIEIDLNNLIDVIYVNPKASNWFYDLVVDVMKKYDINAEIKKSELYTGALF